MTTPGAHSVSSSNLHTTYPSPRTSGHSSTPAPAEVIDTFAKNSVRPGALSPTTTTATTSQKSRRPSESQKGGRFSLVTVAREKKNKVLEDLSLREKPSQNQLTNKSVKGAHTGSPRPSYSQESPLASRISRDSFSSVATSPREDDRESLRFVKKGAVNLARPSLDRAGSSRRRLNTHGFSGNQDHPGKMHQTSSRLLRMTDDDRPFTRDFKDLFSTLMVSLPLTPHRVRFQRVEHSFTSEEAINNLGSLKFSQSNRMPDPKDPSRIVTTTTTTTFSMAKEMARAVCQRFLEARFIEATDGKQIVQFPLKGPVWQLTPKGIMVLQRFCQRNGIQQRHVLDLIESPRNTMTLVILERDPTTDRLSHDKSTVEVIFRRFAGQSGPNIRSIGTGSDSDLHDEGYNGIIGIRQAKERRVVDKIVRNTFTGKGVTDWLMDCTTIIDRRETYEVGDLFIQNGLIECVVEDKAFLRENPGASRFQPTRSALYTITFKGRQAAGWERREDARAEINRNNNVQGVNNSLRETNNNRLLAIVNEPSLRLLFREYLISTHCEENLSFFLEVREFTASYDQAERAKAFTRNDAIRETLAAAYGLYNAFLAPGSPNELNIDHNLRNGLASRMTRAVGDDESMLKSLQEVVNLFKEAQSSVFKLMSSDSVPKFLKEPKFARQLREYNFDQLAGEQRRGDSPPGRASC